MPQQVVYLLEVTSLSLTLITTAYDDQHIMLPDIRAQVLQKASLVPDLLAAIRLQASIVPVHSVWVLVRGPLPAEQQPRHAIQHAFEGRSNPVALSMRRRRGRVFQILHIPCTVCVAPGMFTATVPLAWMDLNLTSTQDISNPCKPLVNLLLHWSNFELRFQ